jgi:hypothetical protein
VVSVSARGAARPAELSDATRSPGNPWPGRAAIDSPAIAKLDLGPEAKARVADVVSPRVLVGRTGTDEDVAPTARPAHLRTHTMTAMAVSCDERHRPLTLPVGSHPPVEQQHELSRGADPACLHQPSGGASTHRKAAACPAGLPDAALGLRDSRRTSAFFYRATGLPPKVLWSDGALRKTPTKLDALTPAEAERLQRMGIHQVRLGVVPLGRRRGTPFMRALHRGWLDVPFFSPVLDELVVILQDLRRQGAIQQR